MKYKEFLIGLNGKEKRLGILGESHIYLLEESMFAEDLVKRYDVIAYEGTDKYTSISLMLSYLLGPMFLAYNNLTNRSDRNPTAKAFAKFYNKNLVYLERDAERLIPVRQKFMMLADGLYALIDFPSSYRYLKKYGDPYEKGTKAYEIRIKKERERNNNSFFSRLKSYFNLDPLKTRDRIMAKRSIDLLKNNPNLLVVCGEAHLDGIVKNLCQGLKLKEQARVEDF